MDTLEVRESLGQMARRVEAFDAFEKYLEEVAYENKADPKILGLVCDTKVQMGLLRRKLEGESQIVEA